jgi:hypothetical protein
MRAADARNRKPLQRGRENGPAGPLIAAISNIQPPKRIRHVAAPSSQAPKQRAGAVEPHNGPVPTHTLRDASDNSRQSIHSAGLAKPQRLRAEAVAEPLERRSVRRRYLLYSRQAGIRMRWP